MSDKLTKYKITDKNTAGLLKFLCAVMIMLGHIWPKDSFVFCGWLYTSIFFFYSGYGTRLSYINDLDYKKGYIFKKLLTVWMPYSIMNSVFYIVFSKAFNSEFTLKTFIFCLLGIKISNPILWYCVEICIIYLITYLLDILSLSKKIYILWLLYLVFILLSVKSHILSYWYTASVAYILGIHVADNKIKLSAIIRYIFSIVFVFTYIIYWTLKNNTNQQAETMLLTFLEMILVPLFLVFVTTLFQLLPQIKFGTKKLQILSYPIYLSHIVFHIYFYFKETNQILLILKIISCTLTFSILAAYINSIIKKIYQKNGG